MKKKKRIVGLFLFAVLLVAFTGSVQAASQKSKALKAYNQFLSKTYIDWETGYVETKDCSFALACVDKDNVPELLVWGAGRPVYHASGYARLYTYKNGKVVQVAKIRDGFRYYKKTGIYIATSFLRGQIDYYAKLSGTSTKGKLTSFSSYKTTYSDEKGKTISKSAFQKKLKKLVGKKKPSIPKAHKNTSANRKKYLK